MQKYRLMCALFMLLCLGGAPYAHAVGGSLIISNGFEVGESWTFATSGTASGGSVTNLTAPTLEIPTNSRIRSGSYSWQNRRYPSGTTASCSNTIEFASIDIGTFTARQVVVHLASISIFSTANGADGADFVQVSAAVNGAGFPSAADVKLNGATANNAIWSFEATNSLHTQLGTAVASNAPVGGPAITSNAFSSIYIDLPDSATSVAVRISAFNNATNELWCLDDIEVRRDATDWAGGPAAVVTNAQFAGSSASAGEASGAYTVTVYKTTGSGNVSGSVALSGSATEGGGNDYTVDTTNFTMNGATTSATFTITINDDATPESLETIVLTLANVVGGGVGSPSVFTLSLTDNDVAPFTNNVWINEVNYNPAGTDTGEYVEVAGAANADLTPYRIVLYNGTGGAVYNTFTLSGSLDDEGCGYGAISIATAAIQNGDPDGVALVRVDAGVTSLVQFVNYGGTFAGVGGPADGATGSPIGSQNNSDNSVQLQGSGSAYTNFSWGTNILSPGSLNIGQTISPCTPATNTPPTLAAIGNKVTLTNLVLNFVVTATPTDSDVVTLTASNLPSGASFFATNEAGSFNWPSPGPAGVYTTSFYAADDDGVDSETITITVTNSPSAPPAVASVWINELHYDNAGADVNEGVEIAGPAGTDLGSYVLVLYDGTAFNSYSNAVLNGIIPNETNGFGAIWFDAGASASGSIQNGSPDGMALAFVSGGVTTLVQFLSYEGSFVGGNGPASGVSSVDIGAQETGSTGTGDSLQLCGTGTNYAEIIATGSWVTNAGSHGVMSTCESIPGGGVDPNDTDGDGMADNWETLYFGTGTNGAAGDVDSDGFLNIEEFVAFTDPTNSASFFAVTAVTNGSINVVVPSVTGRQYRLLTSPLMGAQSWTNVVAGPTSGTGGNIALGVSGADTTSALRVRVQMQ